MKVWRIESKGGTGPYSAAKYCFDLKIRRELYPWAFKDEERWYHITPQNEPAIRERFYARTRDDVFGFPSVEAYIKWFNKPHWRRLLEENDFLLVKYDAKDATASDVQCMFNHQKAVKLAEYAPTAFDEKYGDYWEIR